MKKNVNIVTSMDTFIIPSNGKMQEVMDWYKDNKEWLSTMEFIPPFKDGIIDFQEENIQLEFHAQSEFVYYMIIYMENMKMASYVYYIKQDEIKNLNIIPNVSKEKRVLMMSVLQFDNTPWKTKMKWLGLMQFSLHFRKKVVTTRTSAQSKNLRSKSDIKTNIKTLGYTYYVSSVPKMKDGKRVYTKPEHAVDFRPTYRHYKNGKVVYVKGGTRYKDKGEGPDEGRTYKL